MMKKAATEERKASWFNKDFYTQGEKNQEGKSVKGARRDQDSPHYWMMAVVLAETLGLKGTWLDIGCGMGWTVKHLLNLGVKEIEGIEISKWAVENAVCKRVSRGDIVRLRNRGKQWSRILCDRVLGYLDEGDALKAIKALKRCLREDGYLVCAIVCSDHKSAEVRNNGAWGRAPLRPKSWYLDRFKKIGLVVEEKMTRAMAEPRGWDCVWIFRHSER